MGIGVGGNADAHFRFCPFDKTHKIHGMAEHPVIPAGSPVLGGSPRRASSTLLTPFLRSWRRKKLYRFRLGPHAGKMGHGMKAHPGQASCYSQRVILFRPARPYVTDTYSGLNSPSFSAVRKKSGQSSSLPGEKLQGKNGFPLSVINVPMRIQISRNDIQRNYWHFRMKLPLDSAVNQPCGNFALAGQGAFAGSSDTVSR